MVGVDCFLTGVESAEIAAVRARAEAAGLKPTTYIRRCALVDEQAPIDRGRLSRVPGPVTRRPGA